MKKWTFLLFLDLFIYYVTEKMIAFLNKKNRE